MFVHLVPELYVSHIQCGKQKSEIQTHGRGGYEENQRQSGSGQSQSSELISAVIIIIIMIMLKYVRGKRIQKRHKDSPDRVRSNIIPSFTPFHPQHPRYQISPILYNLTNFS